MDISISNSIKYIGVDDEDIDLFESQYVVPEGVSYNSYLIMDEKIALMDTVDERKEAEALNSALDTLNSILGKTEDGEEEKPMTQADVVVLTALTNFVFNNVDNVIGSLDTLGKDDSGMSDTEKDELKKQQEEA